MPELRRAGGGWQPRALWVLVAVAAAATIAFAWLVARHLARDARWTTETYARVFRGLADPREGGATEALLQLATTIRQEGIPLVVTDARGVPTDTANLPRPMKLDSPELRAFVARLDRVNPPVVEPAVGTVHFGAPPVRAQLRVVFGLMVAALLAVLGGGVLVHRTAMRGSRDRVFVAMARESAHQLGTPLSSLAGWVEQLRAHGDPDVRDVAEHLGADWRRLERVARRFERIGQPPRAERVDLGALATAAVAYFRPRMPRLANAVTIDVHVASAAPVVEGDALLLEWGLEVLVKNSMDALKGRSGRITLTVRDEPEHVVLVVEDDGPGVPPEVQADLFEPGISTKTGGWGLGLALTRRIVEEGHGGTVTLEPSAGARFVIRLRRAERAA